MKVAILETAVTFINRPFVKPLILSSGPIAEATEVRADVRVRVDGAEAVGRGSMYLSVLWAWPDASRSFSDRDQAMRDLCTRIGRDLQALCGGQPAHPLELGMHLHEAVLALDLAMNPPSLARSNCLSPFDAAIHDGAGLALNRSGFSFYSEPDAIPSADRYFGDGGAVGAIRDVLRPPLREQVGWVIVGHNDGPEDIAPWVRARGFRAFKIKLLGRDPEEDARRTAVVFQTLRSLGRERPRLAADNNCAYKDVSDVLAYLERLQGIDAEAYGALEYMEQATGRDVFANRFDWRPAALRKPIVLDEGLTDMEALQEAAAQGFSGAALKTCKGHSFALVAAAWARQHGLRLMMQDLTNPGFAAIHSALFAAHLHCDNGLELNSPQFTPAANAEWMPRLKALFEPDDGIHRLPEPPPGLGSAL